MANETSSDSEGLVGQNESSTHCTTDAFVTSKTTLEIQRCPGTDPDKFPVTIYYKDAATEEKVEIARVDTAHGFTHFDKNYRPDQPKEEVEWGYWEAIERLLENWESYAQRYEANHG